MKVTVSKEVANAFEYLKEIRNETSDNHLLAEHAEAFTTRDWKDNLEPLNNVDLITFAKMLIDGYEVDLTTEEKFLEEYQEYLRIGAGHRTLAEGMRMAIDILGIKIPGVNDSV